LEKQDGLLIHFLSHEDLIAGSNTTFEVIVGVIGDLPDFSGVECLGTFFESPATDWLEDPQPGTGYYYLARGVSSCIAEGYGDSTVIPDPRDTLDSVNPCDFLY
jgi:hypothetical protein